MSALRFDCRFHYRAGFALDFAFVAERGVTALVGPSGCGKTTVLNLIAGLLTPAEGVIALGDRVLFDSQAGVNIRPERRSIGYVFQDYQLFPPLSVLDNLRYGERRNQNGAVDFKKIVATLDLNDMLARTPRSLSGGQKQRVALGRALLRSPRLLLLDEPLNALDVDLRSSIGQYLSRAIQEFQIPTVLVSHDPASIASLADSTVGLPSTGPLGRGFPQTP
jgi:molybdate transport system ATP-binding protein